VLHASFRDVTDHLSEPHESSALDQNVREIVRWEQDALHSRSSVEQLSDWITGVTTHASVLIGHAMWFVGWILVNVGAIPGIRPFDAFPFPLLTLLVSLEAIFLALFVLASQNRLAHQADKRAHLDLQIDLLAEREMTAVLQLLQDLARHLGAKVSVTPNQIRELATKTDLHALTTKVDEIPAEESHDAVQDRR
jgi:uncharacterized membrane protein